MSNIFAPSESEAVQVHKAAEPRVKRITLPNYSASPSGLLDHILAFLIGFAVLFIFYRLIVVSIIGGVLVGVVYIFVAEQNAIQKRKSRLRASYYYNKYCVSECSGVVNRDSADPSRTYVRHLVNSKNQ